MSQSHTNLAVPIVSGHVVLQFARRGNLANAQFLYGEVARRMLGRLQYIRLKPSSMLDAGCGAGDSLPLLRKRYPDARYLGLDACASLLTHARTRHTPTRWIGWVRKLTQSRLAAPRFIQADLASTHLPPESLGLIWSNLALHWHSQPQAVLAEWRRILQVDGLVMFSWLGPTTLRELRLAVNHAGLRTTTLSFMDMHDVGDLLVENGFASPVMDQETLTFTYREPIQLLKDVYALGGNPARDRRAGLVGRAWRDRLCAALEAQRQPNGQITLTIEVAYGHAWRPALHRTPAGETRLSVSAIKSHHRE